jgi:two-component system sensor histidine kinase QseC
MSLRARLLVVLLSGVTLSLLVGGVGLYLFTRERLVAEFRATMLAQARAVAATVVVDGGELEIEAVSGDSAETPLVYRIVGPRGGVLAAAGDFTWEGVAPELPVPGTYQWVEVELPGDHDGLALTYGFHPAIENTSPGSPATSDDAPTSAWITVVRPTADLDRSVAVTGSAITGFGVLVLGTTGVLVWIGVRAGLRPLDRFVQAIEDLRPDSLELGPPPAGTPAELRPAYGALAQALDRVREAMARERRFTDAAAHELRTPIAELRTSLEVARRWPERDRVVLSLDRAEGVIANMTNLIEALLALSRSTSELAATDTERASAGKIVREESDRVSDRARDSGITLTVSVAQDWDCPQLAGQIITRNLLENAVEYSPRGGRTDVEVDEGRIRISNGPVHLDSERIGRMYEPFWRAEDARSDRRHHGLGLAIVRHVAEGCGLTCHTSLSGESLTFTVSPVTDGAAARRP